MPVLKAVGAYIQATKSEIKSNEEIEFTVTLKNLENSTVSGDLYIIDRHPVLVDSPFYSGSLTKLGTTKYIQSNIKVYERIYLQPKETKTVKVRTKLVGHIGTHYVSAYYYQPNTVASRSSEITVNVKPADVDIVSVEIDKPYYDINKGDKVATVKVKVKNFTADKNIAGQVSIRSRNVEFDRKQFALGAGTDYVFSLKVPFYLIKAFNLKPIDYEFYPFTITLEPLYGVGNAVSGKQYLGEDKHLVLTILDVKESVDVQPKQPNVGEVVEISYTISTKSHIIIKTLFKENGKVFSSITSELGGLLQPYTKTFKAKRQISRNVSICCDYNIIDIMYP